jgi:pimeloyl-ACP methyl ester carboxylesterase
MHSEKRNWLVVGSLFIFIATLSSAQAATEVTSGSLPDGTPYRIDYPDNFNGTLLVALDYAPGGGTQATNVELQRRGYATSGVSRSVTGWAVGDAIENHVRVVDLFTAKYGPPTYTFVNGNSLGALTGASAVQARPDVFDGAVLQCGGLAGSVGAWNGKLDGLFIAKELLAPGNPTYPVIDIPDNFATVTRPAWLAMVQAAQQTPEGKARIALAAAIAQLPAWSVGSRPFPAPGDYVALQQGLYDSFAGGAIPMLGQAMSSRNEINRRAGGNISWNLGIDYAELLDHVDNADVVMAMYDLAGLSLEEDLAALAAADRFVADPDAIRWARVSVQVKPLEVPVLTINGIGDQISAVAAAQAYEAVVGSENLRQTYTMTAGHCGFNGKEVVAAVEVLQDRVLTGSWQDTSHAAMNALAATVTGVSGTPRFIEYEPDEYERFFTFPRLDVKANPATQTIHLGKANDKIKLTLSDANVPSDEFVVENIVLESLLLGGAAASASKVKEGKPSQAGTLDLEFRVGDLVDAEVGEQIALHLSGSYLNGVPIDEDIVFNIQDK